MKLKILYVKESGNLQKERVVLKVLSKTDIGNYVLSDTTYHDDESVSNKLRHIFWFPDKIVNAGDYIALYTKSGTDREFENKSNTITHRFHWGIEKSIWNKDGDGAVVFQISEWIAKKVLPGK